MERTRIVIIAGPTASGKSGLAVELAERFGGEVVSADSMQVYRGMDIGTAKISVSWRRGVPHHLIDVCEPSEDYSAARFAKDAGEKIDEIRARGRSAFIAGGTGLYIKALVGGLCDAPSGDRALREALMAEAEADGAASLHERLRAIDPASASAIHPNNLPRVIRAIEVAMLTGRPISEAHRGHGFAQAPYDTLKIGIMAERDALCKAIEERVDGMIKAGLVEEARGLFGRYGHGVKPLSGLGYKEMAGYLNGLYPLGEAVSMLKTNTRRYAKRQMTWFRKDAGIRWFSIGQKDDIMGAVEVFLQRRA
ncbi:MAG: tRNA (adenosine(37)-N6)-dimethylallyltransferase MiaA [Deltaproteobacteria bacterium]|nr:tRNA (adenosine(37)-N6)-dimethylallyltransferase MiaA [Deltaproteobacteria bacterium]